MGPPPHIYAHTLHVCREVWREFARQQGTGTGDYVRFCNMLISDSIYLLDESLKKIQDVREKETIMADPTAWLALGPQVRAGRGV